MIDNSSCKIELKESCNQINYDIKDSINNKKIIKEFKQGHWKKDEQFRFIKGCLLYENNWKKIQECVETRSSNQIRSHAQKYIIKLTKKHKTKYFYDQLNKSFFDESNSQDNIKLRNIFLSEYEYFYSYSELKELHEFAIYRQKIEKISICSDIQLIEKEEIRIMEKIENILLKMFINLGYNITVNDHISSNDNLNKKRKTTNITITTTASDNDFNDNSSNKKSCNIEKNQLFKVSTVKKSSCDIINSFDINNYMNSNANCSSNRSESLSSSKDNALLKELNSYLNHPQIYKGLMDHFINLEYDENNLASSSFMTNLSSNQSSPKIRKSTLASVKTYSSFKPFEPLSTKHMEFFYNNDNFYSEDYLKNIKIRVLIENK